MDLWNHLRDRHDDGTKHRFVRSDKPLGPKHWCDGDYCHHYRVVCAVCGVRRVHGYGIQEVR